MPPRLCAISAPRALPSTTVSLRLFSNSTCLRLDREAPPRTPFGYNSRTPSSSSSSLLSSIDSSSTNSNSAARRPGDAAQRLLMRYKDRADVQQRQKQAQVEHLREVKISNDYLRHMPRKWASGDLYSPNDMGPIAMDKWKRRMARSYDIVDALDMRPKDMYKNYSLIQDFTTPSGMILHSRATGLSRVNQRKVAKMVRRVQGLGLYPTIHAHPEMLRDAFFPRRR